MALHVCEFETLRIICLYKVYSLVSMSLMLYILILVQSLISGKCEFEAVHIDCSTRLRLHVRSSTFCS